MFAIDNFFFIFDFHVQSEFKLLRELLELLEHLEIRLLNAETTKLDHQVVVMP